MEKCSLWPKDNEEFFGVCGAGSEVGGVYTCTTEDEEECFWAQQTKKEVIV